MLVLLPILLLACGNHRPAPEAEPTPTPAPTPVVLPSEGLQADLARTQAFFATRPVYEQPLVTDLSPVPGLPSLSAETCGACHTEIYREWKASTHAHAWTDRQYQAEITKSGNRWLCLNCHTPLLAQQDLWPVGLIADDVEAPQLVPNPAFDPSLRNEGITCAACHVRDGVIHGPGLSQGAAPHPVQADAGFTDQSLCLRCHQAVATYPGKGFVCTFRTGEEWREGPYDERGQGCVECHMPRITRPMATSAPPREGGRHSWRGAGIPKEPGVWPASDQPPPGLDLQATWTDQGVQLDLINAHAGHRLPTGDPERAVIVELRFFAGDAEIGEPFVHRMGQTWVWWPEPRKEGDNRLAPEERRRLDVPRPAEATRAVITATSRRISEETASYHHLGDYPREVITHRVEVDAGGSTGGRLPIATGG
jgi:nitrate reductase cytochrome c-type subunit